jgi:pimeloyl-ACP methyl ester carboxylesterase
MAADAAAILDRENIDHVHVMGHSMGGLIALGFALMNPARIKSLILACTFADGAAPTRFSWKMAALGIRCRVGTRAMRRDAMLEMIMPAHYLRSIDRGRLAADLAAVIRSRSRRSAAHPDAPAARDVAVYGAPAVARALWHSGAGD